MEPLVNGDVTLKPHDLQTAPALFEMIERNRDHLKRFFGWVDDTKEVKDSETFIQKSIEAFEAKKQVPLQIWYQDHFVGLIDFHGISDKNKLAQVGYWIDKEYEGKGIVTKACELLFKYGFEIIGLNRIEIECNVENSRSSAIPQRLGCTKEGVLRQARELNGGFQDMELWSILKSEYVK
jgi:ribosomal-protein-serine acetyltransferase